jgi:hypothetical protein
MTATGAVWLVVGIRVVPVAGTALLAFATALLLLGTPR